jgi:hypothetical protein
MQKESLYIVVDSMEDTINNNQFYQRMKLINELKNYRYDKYIVGTLIYEGYIIKMITKAVSFKIGGSEFGGGLSECVVRSSCDDYGTVMGHGGWID